MMLMVTLMVNNHYAIQRMVSIWIVSDGVYASALDNCHSRNSARNAARTLFDL